MHTFIEENEKGVLLRVHVVPNSDANRIAGYDHWRKALKVHVTAPATENRANSCLVEFLAEFFDVAERNIELVSGHHSREKIVSILGITKKSVEERIKNAGNKKA
ncbi:MAG: DUF167 domain-containing protein [Thermoplasmata archaeon]